MTSAWSCVFIIIIILFFSEYYLFEKAAGHLRGGVHSLHPSPGSAPWFEITENGVIPRLRSIIQFMNIKESTFAENCSTDQFPLKLVLNVEKISIFI